MAVTYVIYNPATPIGAELAKAANALTEGRASLERAFAAINTATNGGASRDNLIGGDFGALNSANASLMWDQTWAAKNLLDSIDAGGYAAAVASLDKGQPA